MMQKIRLLLIAVGLIVLVTAMVQNSDPLTLKLFWLQKTVPTSVLVLATSLISFLLGGLPQHLAFRHRREPTPNPPSPPANESSHS
jgi:uncharacterized integral membrane protein